MCRVPMCAPHLAKDAGGGEAVAEPAVAQGLRQRPGLGRLLLLLLVDAPGSDVDAPQQLDARTCSADAGASLYVSRF